jgi:hypothetical protein
MSTTTQSDSRVFTASRAEQGFRSQAHLDAFFRYHDHVQDCAECSQPGEPALIDDGMQATCRDCPTAVELFRASFGENFDYQTAA